MRSSLLLLLLAAAPVFANGYEKAHQAYREGEAAFQQGDYAGAIKGFAGVFEYNDSYGYAAAAACQIALALDKGAEAKTPGFLPFERATAVRFVRYSLGLAPDVDYAYVSRQTASPDACRTLWLKWNPGKTVGRDVPLVPQGNELQREARKLTQELASRVRVASSERFREEFETLEHGSPYEGSLAIDRIVASGKPLTAAEKLALFDAVTGNGRESSYYRYDSRETGLLQALQRGFPDFARGIEPQLESCLYHPGPLRQVAAAYFLAKIGHPGTLKRVMELYERSLIFQERDATSIDAFRIAFAAFPEKDLVEAFQVLVLRLAQEKPPLDSEERRDSSALPQAVTTLWKLGRGGQEAVVRFATNRERPKKLRLVALETVLHNEGAVTWFEALKPLAEDKDQELRKLFVSALPSIDRPEAVELARRIYQSADTVELRLEALRAIRPERLSNPESLLPLLQDVLAKTHEHLTDDMHRAAIVHLGKIRQRASLDMLLRYKAQSSATLRAQLNALAQLRAFDPVAVAAFGRTYLSSEDRDICDLARALQK
jgi:hypothetical protein